MYPFEEFTTKCKPYDNINQKEINTGPESERSTPRQ